MTGGSSKATTLQRWIPVIKIGVAVALIAFLVWIVPIRDQLRFAASSPADDRVAVGTIQEIQADGWIAFQEAGDQGRLLLVRMSDEGGLRDDEIVSVSNAAGEEIYRRPSGLAPSRTPRLERGILTVIRSADLLFLLLALALVFVGSLVATYRWFLLLRADKLVRRFRRAFDLTFIGLFFNNLMPGLTGGDVVKAVYIARDHRHQKTEAVLTVILDRILGITGLALVAGVVLPVYPKAFFDVAPWIYGLLLAEGIFCCVFFSRRIRRTIRLDALLARLPLARLVQKIDHAAFIYRYRKALVGGSLLLSMGVHLFIVGGIGVMGLAIGLDVPVLSYFAVVPITLIIMALPIAPSGWGVGEMAVIYFWGTQGVPRGEAFALALAYRMTQLAISLIGGICLLCQKNRISKDEVEEFGQTPPRPGSGPEA
ncbi:MAG: lysylphosphatidylglycerol synthase transmembrane domain-containing protein [Planctomycetota bacterium]